MPKKKQVIQALRGPMPKPKVKRERVGRDLFMSIVAALRDSAPLPETVHFDCKDAQHKECVHRIALALGALRRRGTDLDDYVMHFTFLIRG